MRSRLSTAIALAVMASAMTPTMPAQRQPRAFDAIDSTTRAEKLRGKPWASKKAKRRKA